MAKSANETRPKSFRRGDIVRRRGSATPKTVEETTHPVHHWANTSKIRIDGRWERQSAFIWLASQQPDESPHCDEENEKAESIGRPCRRP